ncbi:unnamed protein product [Mytilus coruscus]|uniref:HYR domain-containing protein n=1 Tax=Mytilus coruscus TaxID=42192 RepID=A0A6J8D938_MYTCO|nr:unnamed protein product [Mytilus coruscus]
MQTSYTFRDKCELDRYRCPPFNCESVCCKGYILDDDNMLQFSHITNIYQHVSEPKFLDCPREGHKVNLYIKHSINQAELCLPFTVIDWKGDELETTVSKTNFSRCKCSGPQEEIVHVTAVDEFGNEVDCHFTVSVIGSAIVGALFIILIMMALGMYRLYKKRRQFNNTECHQLNSLGRRQLNSSGNHQLNNPERRQLNSSGHHQLNNPERRQLNSTGCRELNSTCRLPICRDSDSDMSQRETHDNPVFAIYNDDPPPYEIAAFDKLPDYSPPTFPPSYETVQSSIEFTVNAISEIPQLEPFPGSSPSQTNEDYSIESNAEIPVNTVSKEIQNNTLVQQFLERDLHPTVHVNMRSDHVHFQINSNSIQTDV